MDAATIARLADTVHSLPQDRGRLVAPPEDPGSASDRPAVVPKHEHPSTRSGAGR